MNELKEFIKEVQDLDCIHDNIDKLHIHLLEIATKEKNLQFFEKEFQKTLDSLQESLKALEKICLIKRQTLGEINN